MIDRHRQYICDLVRESHILKDYFLTLCIFAVKISKIIRFIQNKANDFDDNPVQMLLLEYA